MAGLQFGKGTHDRHNEYKKSSWCVCKVFCVSILYIYSFCSKNIYAPKV